jgi:hypothetical protein
MGTVIEAQDDDPLDAHERKAIGVPADETLRLHAGWLAEAYGPATVDGLREGAARLRLTRDRWGFDAERIASARRNRLAVSYSHLAWLTAEPPDGLASFMSGAVQGHVPAGVQSIRPSWYSITPSLSVLVCEFVPDEASMRLGHVALTAEHRGQREAHADGSESRWPPSEVQRRAFRSALLGYLDDARIWLQRELPGEFARVGAVAPSAELVTARLFDPFDPDDTRGVPLSPFPTYRYGAELSGGRALRNTKNPALALSDDHDTHGRHLWFGGKLDTIADNWTQPDDTQQRDAAKVVSANASRRLPSVVAIHAVDWILRDLYATLAAQRDQPAHWRAGRRPRRQLAQAVDAVPLLVDAQHIAEDLADAPLEFIAGGYDGADFALRQQDRPDRSQWKHMQYSITQGARALDQAERRTRDGLEVRAGLHAAIAAVDATRLAILAVVIAVAAIVVSVIASAH